MGKIKVYHHNPNQNSIIKHLKEAGFTYGSGPQGEHGFVNTYTENDERLWVTIDLNCKILYLYNEYTCGGLLWQNAIPIPNTAITDGNALIDWMDEWIS